MMKIPLLLVCVCAVAMTADEPVRPELLQVKNVYLLPMHFGFDQYLANEINRLGVVRIVVDPTKADAIFTDRLGDSLEQKLDQLTPHPVNAAAKPEEAGPAADSTGAAAKAGEPASGGDAKPTTPAKRKPANNSPLSIFDAADTNGGRPATSFSSGRGNVFLIDRSTRSVIWSFYETPRSAQPDDLKRSADRVATALKHAVRGKQDHQ